MGWKERLEIIYHVTGSVAALGTLAAAVFALFVYRKNSRLDRVRWASTLFERFYEKDHLKDIRNTLDCPANSDTANEIVIREDFSFTDYLNFFEFIAFLRHSKQLRDSEVKDLFGYYLSCLERHDSVKQYINEPENGYEGLCKLLRELK